MMKASGRAALILLAGLFLLFGGAAQAAPSSAASGKPDSAGKQADAVKPDKHRRHTSRRTSSKTAQKSSDDKAGKTDAAPKSDQAKSDEAKTANNKTGNNKADNDIPASSQMPPEIANAHAQLAAADTPPAAAASTMTGRANDTVQAAADNTATPNAENQAENHATAPDQLGDPDPAPAQKAVIAATDAQPRPAPVMASSDHSSAWDQSSLIGKIFIGVGTLLTLASAARMFMA